MSDRSQPFPVWFEIARHAHRAPSPHNTQPYRLKIINLREAEVVFLPRRGLHVADQLQGKLDGGSLCGAYSESNEQEPLSLVHRRKHVPALHELVISEAECRLLAEPAQRL
jgi:nitroreductase